MKQLALEELKQMSGQPVWCPELKAYGIIKCEGIGAWKDTPFLCGVMYDSEFGTAVNFEYNIQHRGLTCCSVVSERDIPKKPIEQIDIKPVQDENGAYVDSDDYIYYTCPVCGEWVGSEDSINKFCFECGQAIDTEEEGE